jgi:hypothetical protein
MVGEPGRDVVKVQTQAYIRLQDTNAFLRIWRERLNYIISEDHLDEFDKHLRDNEFVLRLLEQEQKGQTT